MKLIKDLQSPVEIFKSVLLHIMRCNGWNLPKLFESLKNKGNNNPYWYPGEIEAINFYWNLFFNKN